jgi:predicted transposase YdaD
MSDEQKNMSFQEFVQHIERRGEARGKAIGEARGEARERAQSILRERQSIISLAAGLLPPERIEQFQSMQDLDLLTKAIQAALRERVR